MKTKLQKTTEFFQVFSAMILGIIIVFIFYIRFVAGNSAGLGEFALVVILAVPALIIFPLTIILTIAQKIQKSRHPELGTQEITTPKKSVGKQIFIGILIAVSLPIIIFVINLLVTLFFKLKL